MKIEKINENQIRCTLTRADLEDPSLEVSTIFFRSTNDILPLTNALK